MPRPALILAVCGWCGWLLAGCGQKEVDPSVTAPVRSDPKHPLTIAGGDYPSESRRLGEEGLCRVNILVQADGRVGVAQIFSPTPYDRLNEACVALAIKARFLPRVVNGIPEASWAVLPINWKLQADARRGEIAPQLTSSSRLKAGTDHYPREAREQGLEGDCVMHVLVSEYGSPLKVNITRSSGSAILDAACENAVKDAQFAPASTNGEPHEAWTDVSLSWRLPD